MSSALRFGLVGVLFVLVSCEKVADIESSQAERAEAQSEVLLPEPDESGSYFLWSPEEQLAGYRNIEKIFDTHAVKAGGTSHPLPKAERALSISYEVDGARWTEESYMERNHVVGAPRHPKRRNRARALPARLRPRPAVDQLLAREVDHVHARGGCAQGRRDPQPPGSAHRRRAASIRRGGL